MKFDQSWMADLLTMQRKAAELAKNPNSGAEVQNLVRDLLLQWGIGGLPWEDGPESGQNRRTGDTAEPVAKTNWNVDITETRHQVIVETVIPGIASPEGAVLRVVRLPADVTAAGAMAGYREPKLRIILPKTTASEEKTIPVHDFQPQ